MASTPLHDKLKAPFRDDARTDSNGILRCLDRTAVTGDNQRYMSMYDWMARWYGNPPTKASYSEVEFSHGEVL